MYSIDRYRYFLHVMRKNRLEVFRLAGVALATAKFRYVKRCVGKGSIVETRTRIINAGNVRIGKGVLLKEGTYIRAGTEGKIIIGDRSALNCYCRLFGHGLIEIGEDTQIGPGTIITTTDHDYQSNLETRFKGVVIGRGVWIGANVTILPGAEIGDFAVIGAGSVVSRKIPPRSLALGIPARVVMQLNERAEMAENDESQRRSGVPR